MLLDELVRGQLNMKQRQQSMLKLLEEMHAQWGAQAATTAEVVEKAVEKAFAKFAAKGQNPREFKSAEMLNLPGAPPSNASQYSAVVPGDKPYSVSNPEKRKTADLSPAPKALLGPQQGRPAIQSRSPSLASKDLVSLPAEEGAGYSSTSAWDFMGREDVRVGRHISSKSIGNQGTTKFGHVGSVYADTTVALPTTQSQKMKKDLWDATKSATKKKKKQPNSWELKAQSFEEKSGIATLCKKLARMVGMVHSTAKKVVKDTRFDYLVGALVLLNCCTIAAEIELHAQKKHDATHDRLFRDIDTCLNLVFTLELFLRVFTEKKKFVSGKNKFWNGFNTVVVVICLLEEFAVTNDSKASSLRLFRVLRIIRLVRIIRLLRFFRELRAMMWGIVYSIKSLVWVLFLLGVIMFFFSCYLTTMVAEEFMDDEKPSTLTEEDKMILRTGFGSLMSTSYSLYQAITGGQDWSVYANPLFQVSSLLGVVFCFYISFVVFAVLNVVTGVFVDNAIKSTELDTDMMIVEANTYRMRITEGFNEVFKSADLDGSGTVEWNEFEEHFANPTVQAYFRQLGLDLEGPGLRGLWELLDLDQNGSLTIDEMVCGAICLKGSASCLDVARESYMLRRDFRDMLTAAAETQAQQFETVSALQYDVCRIASLLEQKSAAEAAGAPTIDEIQKIDEIV